METFFDNNVNPLSVVELFVIVMLGGFLHSFTEFCYVRGSCPCVLAKVLAVEDRINTSILLREP